MSTAAFLDEARTNIKALFDAAIKTVSPKVIIRNNVKFENNTLYVKDQVFYVGDKNIYMVGFGKAVMNMAIELETILGDRLVKGIISIPDASKKTIWEFSETSCFPNQKVTTVEYREGSKDNQPDDRSLNTTHDILDLVEELKADDFLIVLVSGGGSALLYMPRPTIDAEDKLRLCKTLQNAGADIKEVNIVRRKLSMVKGGGLARMAYPATIVTLIISDIIGDPIDLIASGPTVYSEKAPEEVVGVLRKYNLFKTVEGDLRSLIISKETFNDEQLITPEGEFKHVTNIILANNAASVVGAKQEALRRSILPIIVRNDVQGHVHDVSLAYTQLATSICMAMNRALTKQEFMDNLKDSPVISLTSLNEVNKIYCQLQKVGGEAVVLIGGGEPTVKVTGSGKGGRNQELALYFSLDWLAAIKGNPQLADFDVILFSGGTDGQDGPTDAAGAYGYAAMRPIIHTLHTRLVSKAAEIVAAKKAKEAREEEKNANQELEQETCTKKYLLSNYLDSKPMKKKVKIDKLKRKQELEKQEDAELTPEAYIAKYKLDLTIMELERLLPENILKENDSYRFFSRFKRGADHVKTGFTGSNVMDLHFVYIKRRKCTCEFDAKKEAFEEDLDAHDLHIDLCTLDNFKRARAPTLFISDISDEPLVHDLEGEVFNVTIIDENLRDPCCNKQRKNPK